MSVEVDGLTLKGKQLEIFTAVMQKLQNNETFYYCILGKAGTGKTTLLKAINKTMEEKGASEKCLATSFVSTAAELIGAKTIESTFLLSWLSKEDTFSHPPDKVEQLYKKLREVKLILIDNANFMGAHSFWEVHRRMQKAFNNEELFGGVSVICFGDLFQQSSPFEARIYEGNLWRQFTLLELTENFKIESEEEKVVMNAIADGPTEELKQYLQEHCEMAGGTPEAVAGEFRKLKAENPGKSFAVIAPSNAMVGSIQEALRMKDIKQQTYRPINEVGNLSGRNDHYFLAGERSEVDLTVYEGCHVLLTVNFDGLLHGSVGVVKGFNDHIISVSFNGVDKLIHRLGWFCDNQGWDQFPLILVDNVYNYQMSQGLSFDGVIVVRNIFWHSPARELGGGDFYSAISRARSLRLCRITPIEPLGWRVPFGASEEIERLRAVARD